MIESERQAILDAVPVGADAAVTAADISAKAALWHHTTIRSKLREFRKSGLIQGRLVPLPNNGSNTDCWFYWLGPGP